MAPSTLISHAHSKPDSNGSLAVDAPLCNGNGVHQQDIMTKPSCNGTPAVDESAVDACNGNGHQQDNITKPHSTVPSASSPAGADQNGKVLHDNKSIANGSSSSQTALTDQNGKASHDDKKKGRHAGIGHKTVLQSDALYQYVLETSVYPRENPYQRELREITAKHPWNLMTTPPDEGQFLMLLMKLINAKNTMELGVYTGYSLLSTALALPDDGKIIAIDIHRGNYELGSPVIEKAGLSHKIDFREGLILPQLDEMLLEEKNHGFFDFVFVDADKDNYVNYHERLIKLVKVGGVIGYDNTLWNGSLVAPEDALYPKYVRHYRPFVLELNRVLAADPRIEISQVPIGDGITLCRRVE